MRALEKDKEVQEETVETYEETAHKGEMVMQHTKGHIPPAKEQGRATDNETLAIHIVVPKVMLQTWGAKDIKEFMLKQAAEAIESALKGMSSRKVEVE